MIHFATLQSRFSDSFSPPSVSGLSLFLSLSLSLSLPPTVPPSHPSILLSSSQRVFQGEGEGQGTWWLSETQRKTATGGGPQGKLSYLCLCNWGQFWKNILATKFQCLLSSGFQIGEILEFPVSIGNLARVQSRIMCKWKLKQGDKICRVR